MPLSRRLILGIGGVLAARPAWAMNALQAETVTAEARLRNEGRYLPRWIELLDDAGERERVKQMLGPDQADFIDMVVRDGRSQYASFLGDEAAALADASRSTTAPDPSEQLVAIDALKAIVEASRGHRVVMLNEAHVASRHRHFLALLVRALDEEGFTHLAAETFDQSVETLKAGDAVVPAHGWYIHDPVFAEATREALGRGWGLVSYEVRDHQRSSEPGMSDAATLVREQAQADNLKAALDSDPEMRVLVFVGYGHLREVGPPFGARFKRDTGIDPLTIGQAGIGAFGPKVQDPPPVQALLNKFRPSAPVVLLKPGQSPSSATTGADLTSEETDLIVLHPTLADVEGRPGWLAADPSRRRLKVRTPAGDGPRLLQAIHVGDPEPAIPADQFLVSDQAGECLLLLRPGQYRIRLETPTGFLSLGDHCVS